MDKPYACGKCGKPFRTEEALSNHLDAFHFIDCNDGGSRMTIGEADD